MVLYRLFDRSVGVVSTMVLARLLIPADFGLVAMAMSIIAIIELASAFSFELALIQKAAPEREHFDTAWTLNILIAFGGACLTAALAFPAAAFYGDPRLPAVMIAIAIAWFLSGFESTGIANFRREMNFAAEFRWFASRRMVSFVVVLFAAWFFRSYWALVIGMAAGRLTGVVMSYVMHPFRPRLSLSRARDLFSFSGWLLANNIADVIFSRLPHLFVGRVFGARTLGAYTVGSEIAQLANTELVAPINRAMFPGYARLVDDPETFRRVCIDATAAILLVVLPVSMAVAVLAGPIVRVLLGEQWGQAVPIIHVLAFSGAISALNANNISAYLALGKPYLPTLVLVVRLIIFAAIIGVVWPERGVVKVAYAELAAAAGSFAVSLPILFSLLRLRLRAYMASVWRPLVASVLTAGATQLVVSRFDKPDSLLSALLLLATGLLVFAVFYLFLLWVLWSLSGRRDTIEKLIALKVREVLVGFLRPSPA